MTITVANDTKAVDGVETRVVEEREEADGRVVEVSKNYFALDQRTKDVYYFGEDVDEYKDGRVSHGGSWLAGEEGATFGLMAPGEPKKGDRFYQEQAPRWRWTGARSWPWTRRSRRRPASSRSASG